MLMLDIVTPVTRTRMMHWLRVDMVEGNADAHFDVNWWILHDCIGAPKTCARFNIAGPRGKPWYCKLHKGFEGSDAGWAQRNWHLDNGRPDAFVWWLDDDTRIPARFFSTLAADLGDGEDVDAVVYAMKYPLPPDAEAQGVTEPRILHPDPSKVEVGGISGSMVIFRRSVVGPLRANLVRTSDGTFLKGLFERLDPDRVLWVDDPVILYNAQDPARWQ